MAFDGLAEAVSVLLNAAMLSERSEYLGAAPYERSASRVGYANGFKDKTVKSRLGELRLRVPQTREGSFYPQSLEKGCARSAPCCWRSPRCTCRGCRLGG
jgi:putative transposase